MTTPLLLCLCESNWKLESPASSDNCHDLSALVPHIARHGSMLQRGEFEMLPKDTSKSQDQWMGVFKGQNCCML